MMPVARRVCLAALLVTVAAAGGVRVAEAAEQELNLETLHQYQEGTREVPSNLMSPSSGSFIRIVGTPSELLPQILGGAPSFLPEVVRITFSLRDGRTGLCTGVAVADDRVLTAGHCGCGVASTYEVEFPKSAATAGDAVFFPPVRLVRAPLLFFTYDCSRPEVPQPGRDFALLFLNGPVSNEFKNPPPVAPMFLVAGDRVARLLMLGYGRTEEGDFPRNLLLASSPILDPFCLQNVVATSPCAGFREFALSNLLSDFRQTTDTCDGDSGGPVYWIGTIKLANGQTERHRFLVGITSRGLEGVPQFGSTGCGGGGIYSAIGHVDVLAWLNANGAPLEVGLFARHFAEIAVAGN